MIEGMPAQRNVNWRSSLSNSMQFQLKSIVEQPLLLAGTGTNPNDR